MAENRPLTTVTDEKRVMCSSAKILQSSNEPLLTYLLTYLLHGAVLLEKLPDLQLVKKFPAFHGTRRFITTTRCVVTQKGAVLSCLAAEALNYSRAL